MFAYKNMYVSVAYYMCKHCICLWGCPRISVILYLIVFILDALGKSPNIFATSSKPIGSKQTCSSKSGGWVWKVLSFRTFSFFEKSICTFCILSSTYSSYNCILADLRAPGDVNLVKHTPASPHLSPLL